jgi:hypothetical protein
MLTALGYQVVFRKPVSEIFPGLFHAVEAGVEERLEEFERELSVSAAKDGAGDSVDTQAERIHEGENDESM